MEVINFIQTGDVSVGRFRCEEIAASNVLDVKTQLLDMIENGRRKLLLNFARIRFLYSDVLEMLINVHKKLKENDGRLVICGLQPVIQEIFNTTRLDTYFEITDSEEAALEKMGAPSNGESA